MGEINNSERTYIIPKNIGLLDITNFENYQRRIGKFGGIHRNFQGITQNSEQMNCEYSLLYNNI